MSRRLQRRWSLTAGGPIRYAVHIHAPWQLQQHCETGHAAADAAAWLLGAPGADQGPGGALQMALSAAVADCCLPPLHAGRVQRTAY